MGRLNKLLNLQQLSSKFLIHHYILHTNSFCNIKTYQMITFRALGSSYIGKTGHSRYKTPRESPVLSKVSSTKKNSRAHQKQLSLQEDSMSDTSNPSLYNSKSSPLKLQIRLSLKRAIFTPSRRCKKNKSRIQQSRNWETRQEIYNFHFVTPTVANKISR